MKKVILPIIILAMFYSCHNQSYTMRFHLSNATKYNEDADLAIYLNGKLISLDTLKPTKIADSYLIHSVNTQKGEYKITIKSSLHTLVKEITMNLYSDTSMIIEYQHGYIVDTTATGRTVGLSEGKKDISVLLK